MATLSELQAWRDELVKGRLTGVRRFHDSNGEEIEYRSDRELASAIAAADRAIAEASGQRPVLSITFKTSKGL